MSGQLRHPGYRTRQAQRVLASILVACFEVKATKIKACVLGGEKPEVVVYALLPLSNSACSGEPKSGVSANQPGNTWPDQDNREQAQGLHGNHKRDICLTAHGNENHRIQPAWTGR